MAGNVLQLPNGEWFQFTEGATPEQMQAEATAAMEQFGKSEITEPSLGIGHERSVDIPKTLEQSHTQQRAVFDPMSMTVPLGGGAIPELAGALYKGVKSSPGAIGTVVKETAKAISPIPTEGKVPLVESAKSVAHLLKGGVEKLMEVMKD